MIPRVVGTGAAMRTLFERPLQSGIASSRTEERPSESVLDVKDDDFVIALAVRLLSQRTHYQSFSWCALPAELHWPRSTPVSGHTSAVRNQRLRQANAMR